MADTDLESRLRALDALTHPAPKAAPAERVPTLAEARKAMAKALGAVASFIVPPRRDDDRGIRDDTNYTPWKRPPEPQRVDRSMAGWRVIGRAPGVRDPYGYQGADPYAAPIPLSQQPHPERSHPSGSSRTRPIID